MKNKSKYAINCKSDAYMWGKKIHNKREKHNTDVIDCNSVTRIRRNITTHSIM